MRKIGFLLLMFSLCLKDVAYAVEQRVGLSLGPTFWNSGIISLSYDQTGLLPNSARNWTLGAELSGFSTGFIIEPRALYWQNKNLSGFYGGPKVALGVADGSYYDDHHSNTDFFIGAGGEGGWAYRFTKEGPKGLDLGGSLDLLITSFGLWGSIKFSIGYLIP